MMNFVTPQEAVYKRSLIAVAQAKRVSRSAQRGNAAAPKLGETNQVVKFIVINKKK